eukprot:scaffold28278_cov26-Tisochrysis_lutea.AAC.7
MVKDVVWPAHVSRKPAPEMPHNDGAGGAATTDKAKREPSMCFRPVGVSSMTASAYSPTRVGRYSTE